MLADRARIEVQAGRGGDGSLSFRRESRVPKGGPDGGDGGRGGDVALRCDDSLRDLQSFRRRGRYRADRGGHGQGALRHGADGERARRARPARHDVERWDGRRYDLIRPGQEVTVARGGPGGRGNKTFATATRQAPRLAERGLPGEEGVVELHLRLLADVGLVGLPNAGKSSLLARMTRAQPKVAAYPFTTLEPVLGTIDADDRQLVLADIPGLIEGASAGAGLGHDFLAHVERTRLLVHVLDLAPLDGSEPDAQLRGDRARAGRARPAARRPAAAARALQGRPRAGRGRAGRARRVARARRLPGARDLERDRPRPVRAARRAARARAARRARARGRGRGRGGRVRGASVPPRSQAFEITRGPDGGWIVSGEAVERLIARWDLDNEEAQALVESRLRRMGVIGALEKAGFAPGDDVEIGGIVFELDPVVLMAVAVVKLGSSIVADDAGRLRLSVMARICEEVETLHAQGVDVVVVTSGAIARGIHLLGLPARPRAVEELQAASAVGQGRLYRTYDEYLRERGLQTAQVLLTFFDMSARAHYLNARRTLRKLLEWRIVPVINENDTTTTDEISFGDNDFLAAQVAVLVDASLLLLLTSTAGLFTADPRSDPAARLVAEIADPAALDGLQIGTATSPLGSGGMRSKVAAAEMATAAGIATVIASGFEPGLLARAWAGEAVGTRFAPQPGAPAVVQAVAQVRQAEPGLGRRRRRRRPRAARGRHVIAAGRDRRGRRRVRGGRRDRGPRRRPRRQGDLELLGRRAAASHGDEVRRGARGAAAGDRRSGPPRLLRAPLRARAGITDAFGRRLAAPDGRPPATNTTSIPGPAADRLASTIRGQTRHLFRHEP